MEEIKSGWIKHRITEVDHKEKEGEVYFRVKFHSVVEILDIHPGDTIHLELREEDEYAYIRGEKSRNGSSVEGYYKVHQDNYFEVPKRWNEFFPDRFYQAVVEVNLKDDPHFRMYHPIDYGLHRVPELQKQKYDTLIGESIEERYWEEIKPNVDTVDLASRTPFDGQKVKIVPVNPDFDPVLQESDQQFHGDNIVVTPDDVTSVTKDHTIPAKELDKFSFRWIPDINSANDIDKLKTHNKNRRSSLIFKIEDKGGKEVILPKKGGIAVWAAENGRLGYTWLLHTEEYQGNDLPEGKRINSKWAAKYFDSSDSDESCIKLYLPIPFMTKDPGVWWT
ncbi:hypothetical protein [Natronobacterium texcoconense]|uniref:Uncharacterized protein n=1 Tax=Natronobacterium texcoconense TaxID=1095778 RepID=A0A1H1ALJ7_NATTX|nr:hypothetical protein [Natronobacterium texcoconense]SDQ40548.1 hypothetical protein SAMN04489842_0735 [Natronobacterium texcoconense]